MPFIIDLAGVARQHAADGSAAPLEADAVRVHKPHRLANLAACVNAQTMQMRGEGRPVAGRALSGHAGGAEQRVEFVGVLERLGPLPKADFQSGVVDPSRRREFIVGAQGATGPPGMSAAGDGAKAAPEAVDRIIRTRSTG